MSSDEYVLLNLDRNKCFGCDIIIGRAGRTNEELLALVKQGLFSASFGAVNYDVVPYTETYYCGHCYRKSIGKI